MRVKKLPLFRFTLRKNAIINDIESRNFLGLWQDSEIVISLPAVWEETKNEDIFISVVSEVIQHEYLHHILYKCGCEQGHHYGISHCS